MSYKTPGVYIEEVSLIPPSVAEVETAIPAFIGYTKMAKDSRGDSLENRPVRIVSLLEYEHFFGGPNVRRFQVQLTDAPPYMPVQLTPSPVFPYRLYEAMQLFFANGGGPCYVVSVGNYDRENPDIAYTPLEKGLNAVAEVDEVTLLVVPEAIDLDKADYYKLYQAMLGQCHDLMDRFAILDVRSDEEIADFRTGLGTSCLQYGAAYYPSLRTSIRFGVAEEEIVFTHGADDAFDQLDMKGLKLLYAVLNQRAEIVKAKAAVETGVTEGTKDITKDQKLQFYQETLGAARRLTASAKLAAITSQKEAIKTAVKDAGDAIEAVFFADPESKTKAELDAAMGVVDTQTANLVTETDKAVTEVNGLTEIPAARNANILKYYTPSLEIAVKKMIGGLHVVMPPSPAVAGLYARVDASRGVWKAPANESLNMVIGPTVKVAHEEQRDLNVHSSGKSINAIRAFTGKGTLVWGARTLDGNDNEWRYVSVRRLFNMVEESVKKAIEPFVFEPNDVNTWVMVKSMIESYLTNLWRAGALIGATPEDAFYIHVGLGETMTDMDVLEGRMIVEIGLAAVRPAEFIILRFSHLMQEGAS